MDPLHFYTDEHDEIIRFTTQPPPNHTRTHARTQLSLSRPLPLLSVRHPFCLSVSVCLCLCLCLSRLSSHIPPPPPPRESPLPLALSLSLSHTQTISLSLSACPSTPLSLSSRALSLRAPSRAGVCVLLPWLRPNPACREFAAVGHGVAGAHAASSGHSINHGMPAQDGNGQRRNSGSPGFAGVAVGAHPSQVQQREAYHFSAGANAAHGA